MTCAEYRANEGENFDKAELPIYHQDYLMYHVAITSNQAEAIQSLVECPLKIPYDIKGMLIHKLEREYNKFHDLHIEKGSPDPSPDPIRYFMCSALRAHHNGNDEWALLLTDNQHLFDSNHIQ